jgi:alginate O-acetyltransferase complex protein AlgJ
LYARGEQRIAATGDLAAMLRLDATNTPVENVTIHPIRRVSGTEPPTGDVLFLGDSYANIFSLAEMGWGGDAGFTEQLSYYLNRPVEGILRNDDGAWATRQMLAAEIYAGRDRLQGKKIVIWEFASRELTAGEWKPIRFPESPGTSVAGGDADTSSVVVRGTIQSVSLAPKPGQQPYKDYIRSLLLTDIQVQSGQLDDKEALIYVWAMRDNVLTPEANWGAGSVVTLRLQPWTSVSARLERVNRGELDDPEVLLYTPWWGEIGEKP